mgnify:CR=1 FL=1
MKAEILCVGTELLIGDIVNTNAAYLSKKLSENGIFVYHHTVVGDNDGRLREALSDALGRSDVVVMTGGLGPTYDDMTKETVSSVMGKKLVRHEESEKRILAYFARTDRVPTPNNMKQALMPEGATVFENNFGTAPGCAIESGGKTVVMLPGPPKEMKPMFDDEVLPYLLRNSMEVLVSENVNIFGMGESSVEEKLRDIMTSGDNPTIAPYVDDGEVRVRVTARAENRERAKKLIAPIVEKIKEIIGDFVYGVNAVSLENAVVKTFSERGLTLASAESCTGGLISKRITDIPGSSAMFGYGVCTYANEAKEKILGVKHETLEKYGAVSEATAREMAEGLLRLSGADVAVCTTGLAGPGGGSDEKPVGLVYLAVGTKDGITVKKLLLGRGSADDRTNIRLLASSNALFEALKYAEKQQ